MASRSDGYPIGPEWRIAMANFGIDATDVLRRARLPEGLLSHDRAWLPTESYLRLWQAIEDVVDDPKIPLRVGSSLPTEAFSPPLFAALCSPNLGVALERIATYKHLMCPMRMSSSRQDRLRLEIQWLPEAASSDLPTSLVATELVFLTQLGRIGTRKRIEPIQVMTTVPLEPADAYAEFFGVELELGSTTCLEFSLEDASEPFLTSNPDMWAIFEPDLRRRLDELDASAPMSRRVSSILVELLPSGASSVDAVAQRLATSRRSLQRKLQEERTSYQRVLAETRAALASTYLRTTRLSSGEIGFLLGFKDVSSFIRAFQEWTGTTPERARRSHGGLADVTS